MAVYRDFTTNRGNYGKAQEVTDASAIVMAIKNIILSRPGNYPFTPSLGVDIEKYEFELGDSETLNQIKTDISTQIGRYIPSIENVELDVRLVEDTNEGVFKGRKILGISVSAQMNGQTVDSRFLLYRDMGLLHIYNETK